MNFLGPPTVFMNKVIYKYVSFWLYSVIMYAFKFPLMSNQDLKLCPILCLHYINNILYPQQIIRFTDSTFHELLILHLFDNLLISDSFLNSHSEWKTMQSRVVKVQVFVWHLCLPYFIQIDQFL